MSVVQLEWVHAVAAQERWKEEVPLLQEESCRVVISFTRQKEHWMEMCNRYRSNADDGCIIRGYKAYTEKQAYIYSGLAKEAEVYYGMILEGKVIVDR